MTVEQLKKLCNELDFLVQNEMWEVLFKVFHYHIEVIKFARTMSRDSHEVVVYTMEDFEPELAMMRYTHKVQDNIKNYSELLFLTQLLLLQHFDEAEVTEVLKGL